MHEGKEIINITMADGLSGTYQSAVGAAQIAEDSNITVINSKTLCGPHRYMVEKAALMEKQGKSVSEIIEWLKCAAEKSESFLIPQDFSFLKRGGRLTPVAAAFGHMFKLKSIMTQTHDGKKLDKYAVKRTMKHAVMTLIEHMKEKGICEKHILYVSHANAYDDAKKIAEQIKESFKVLMYIY